MTPPRSIVTSIFDHPWFRNDWRRRLTFLVIAIVAGLLTLFPQTYAAETELLPVSSGGGLSAILSQQSGGALLDLGSLTGNKQSIEADLTIARSYEVLRLAMVKLHAQFPGRVGDFRKAAVELKKKVGIIAIRGSIVQITAHDNDPDFARSLVNTLGISLKERLATISLSEAAQKRAVTEDRLNSASVRLFKAQQALTDFRAKNRLAAPEQQLGAGVSILANLQAQLESRQVAASALRQVAAPNNIQLKQTESQIASLQAEIARAQKGQENASGLTLGSISETNAEYLNLYRDERLADILFQVYTKYTEELTVDELSAMQNMDIIEPAYILPERQLNIAPLMLLILILGTAVLAELYAYRPAVGRPAVRA